MSSDILVALQIYDYASVMVATAVVYDYLLMFSREIEYIWQKPWTWISTTFVLVRYVGLTWAIIGGLSDVTFVSGSQTLRHECFEGTIIELVIVWEYSIFLAATDLVMILRVYAMWDRSKTILYVLLSIYLVQIITSFVLAGIYNNPNTHFFITVTEVLDVSFCSETFVSTPSMFGLYIDLPRFLLGAALIVFAITSTLKQSITMYRATNLWQPNRYMRLLLRDGVIYFLVNALNNVTGVIQTCLPSIANTSWMIVLAAFGAIAMCNMMPRFLIGVRELCDRDLRDRLQGIDTGFGLLSQPVARQNTTVSGFGFTDTDLQRSQIVEVDVDADESHPTRVKVSGGSLHHV